MGTIAGELIVKVGKMLLNHFVDTVDKVLLGFRCVGAEFTGQEKSSFVKLGVADAVTITDADLVVGQPVHREVLTEDAVAQI